MRIGLGISREYGLGKSVFIKNRLLLAAIISFTIELHLCAADSVDQKETKRLGALADPASCKEGEQNILEPSLTAATVNFLEQPSNCDRIRNKWISPLNKHRGMIEKMLENEERYKETHVVFYHGQKGDNRIVVEFLRNVYEWKKKKPLPADFEYLRFWKDGARCPDVNGYLNSFFRSVSDHREDVRAVLLAVNPVLFGNFEDPGECTWDYFLSNRSIGWFSESSLKDIFKKEYFNQKFIKKFIDINKKFRSETGDIVQIFIPKNAVNDCAYFSAPGGAPALEEGIVDGRRRIAENDYDVNRKRYVRSRTLLELLQNKKNTLRHVEGMQLRLLFSKTGPLLNPDMGAKMFRFTSLAPEQLQEYKKQVKEASAEVFAQHTKFFGNKNPLVRRIYQSISGKGDAQVDAVIEKQQEPLTDSQHAHISSVVERLTRPNNIFEVLDCPNAIKKLLAKGYDINTKNRYGETALIYAVKYRALADVQFLVQEGADINARNKYGETALMYAAQHRDLADVQFYVREGADINARDENGKTALMGAIRFEKLDVVKFLIEEQADLNNRDKNGRTALMEAAEWCRDSDVVKALADADTDIDAQDPKGITALMYAAWNGKLDAVLSLLRAQANVNSRDQYGQTPLMFAAHSGKCEVLDALLQWGADTDAKDKDGRTAMDIVQASLKTIQEQEEGQGERAVGLQQVLQLLELNTN